MIGFMLGYKIEELSIQTFQLYNIGGFPLIKIKEWFGYEVGKGQLSVAGIHDNNLLMHPTFIAITILISVGLYWGHKNKTKINYS